MLTANQISLFFTVAMLAVTTVWLHSPACFEARQQHGLQVHSGFLHHLFQNCHCGVYAAAISYVLMTLLASTIAILTLVLRFKFIPQMTGSDQRSEKTTSSWPSPNFGKYTKPPTLNLASSPSSAASVS
jgi:membrane protein insertase Oxa1/YidC/SpoIIIJ